MHIADPELGIFGANGIVAAGLPIASGSRARPAAGTDYYEPRDQRNREHLVRYRQHALARLGYQVTLAAPCDGSPPPGTGAPPVTPREQAA
jgi:hypothetical protein